jgi:hypothetical protein
MVAGNAYSASRLDEHSQHTDVYAVFGDDESPFRHSRLLFLLTDLVTLSEEGGVSVLHPQDISSKVSGLRNKDRSKKSSLDCELTAQQ